MKREYSFNEISRITMGPDNQNKAPPQPYYTASKPRDPWTDKRVEQIKKKYDTPSHRKNYSHFGNHDKSRQFHPEPSTNNPYTSYRNPLRDSSTFSNNAKVDYKPPSANNSYKDEYKPRNVLEDSEHVPRFSCESKENSNFMDKFAQIKNSMKSDTKTPLRENKQSYKSREFSLASNVKIDPRVQNIDKINMKIKKILDCLNENQKYPKFDQRTDLKNSFLKGSIISKDNQSEELEETKILSRQKISFQKQYSVSKSNNLKGSIAGCDKYSHKPNQVQKQDFNMKWNAEGKYEYSRNNEQSLVKESRAVNNFQRVQRTYKIEDQTDSWFEPRRNNSPLEKSRSRSCLGNFTNQEIKLNSGKKLDDEISKINVRIRQFEQEKKKLNIEFKPYNELKYNRSSSNLAEHKTQRSSFKPPLARPTVKPSDHISSSISVSQNRAEKIRTETSQYMNRSVLANNKKTQAADFFGHKERYTFDINRNFKPIQENRPYLNRNNSSVRMNYVDNLALQERQKSGTPEFQQKQKSDKSQSERDEVSIQRVSEDNNRSNELKIKTEEGIEQRKRKLLETITVTFSRQTKRLIQNLLEQVKFDEKLRNAKIWFRDLMNESKWNILREEAMRSGLAFQGHDFEISDEEDNPFYSIRDAGEDFKSLVSRWSQAERYWDENIVGQYDLREFQVEKFTIDKVDLDKKGHFVVEDLVRFLNMQTGAFLRNRDLILVFRRLTASDKLLWSQFLGKLDQRK